MEWQPIETVPKDGTEFQGWVVRTDDRSIQWWEPSCRWREDEYGVPEIWGRVDYDHDDWECIPSYVELTHWMPQPEPPKQA